MQSLVDGFLETLQNLQSSEGGRGVSTLKALQAYLGCWETIVDAHDMCIVSLDTLPGPPTVRALVTSQELMLASAMRGLLPRPETGGCFRR